MTFTRAWLLLTCSLVAAFQGTTSQGQIRCADSAVFARLGGVEPSIDRRGAVYEGAATLLTFLLPHSSLALEPQTVLITGSNSGIGFEASKMLAKRGHTVILGCRTLQKAESAAGRIRAEVSSGTLVPAECNLASLDSIQTFVRDLKVNQLDVICLNAGLCLDVSDEAIQRTADGFELTGERQYFFLALSTFY